MREIDVLTKAELHCHLDGIFDPPMLREARRRGVSAGRPPSLPVSPEALEAAYPVHSYDRFVEWGRAVHPFEGDLERFKPFLAIHLERLKAQDVIYTEIMIASSEIPRDRGELVGKFREFREFVDRQEEGVIQVEFLAIFGRNRTPEFAEEFADRALMLFEAGLIVGAGLAGPERGYPVKPFQRTFARFREAGLGIEIHAGEWCGPESVWDALEYGLPDRIGHGVAIFDDPGLLRHCLDQQIHVEMCPTSNVKTGSVRRLEEHPVRQAKDLGLRFSVNTDDPGAFECSMVSEYELLTRLFGFTDEDCRRVTEEALRVRFQPKLRYLPPPSSPRGALHTRR